ncbi:ribosome maturation factor RimM [Haloimpatiens sp. FM7330]|uniref:ribosome maturation factor RimM n=1 Tax=Haloimpatiens sp. FM7330 TaxID=3298610 RepID=UPI003642BF17
MKEYLSIGEIINTHGIKGELKVYPLTDDMNRFKQLDEVLIDGVTKKILECKMQKDRVILKIEGINSIEEANKYRNKYIKIHRKNAVELEEDAYFITDLIGCKVFDTNGVELGKVYDVIQTGSNDVYWVKGNQETLIPALKSIVVKVDTEKSNIIIKPVKEWQA